MVTRTSLTVLFFYGLRNAWKRNEEETVFFVNVDVEAAPELNVKEVFEVTFAEERSIFGSQNKPFVIFLT